MSEDSRDDKLIEVVYDDACHLKKFSEDPKRANLNEITKFMASLGKHVLTREGLKKKRKWIPFLVRGWLPKWVILCVCGCGRQSIIKSDFNAIICLLSD